MSTGYAFGVAPASGHGVATKWPVRLCLIVGDARVRGVRRGWSTNAPLCSGAASSHGAKEVLDWRRIG